jgi:DNA-binding transcriptional MerR regulator
MPTANEYSITELADLAGTTARTVRYYIALGLLSPPGQVGPGARYGEGHLARLRLIRKLQKEHQPLAEIRGRLAGLEDDAITQLLEGEPEGKPADSAIDYIRSVLGGPAGVQTAHAPARRAPERGAPPGPGPGPEPRRLEPPPPVAEPPPSSATPGPSARSQWERVVLTADVELHVRRPLSRLANKRVERLITIARELLEEDQS